MNLGNMKSLRSKKIIDNKIFKVIVILMLSISISLLSLYLMIGKITNILKYITLLVSFIFSYIYLYKNYNDIIKKIKNNKKNSIISLLLSIIIFYELTISPNIDEVINRFFNIKEVYYLIIPGLSLVITLFFISIVDWFKNFFKKMDNFEKKAYVISSIVLLFLLIFAYSITDFFYQQFDIVYSIDSGLVFDTYIPDPHYYSIKHPFTSLLTFPMYAVVNFIFNVKLHPVIFQFINIQILILIGIELKRLTNNKWVYIFYMLSFPSILFSLFFEKYILIVFVMVSYVYEVFVNKRNGEGLLILSIGSMPSNFFIGLTEFFKKRNLKESMMSVCKIVVMAVLIVVLTGRIQCFTNGFNELMIERGSGTSFFPIMKNVNSASKMIEQSLVAIPSSEQVFRSLTTGLPYDVFFWNDIQDTISYLAILMVFIISVGIIDICKKKMRNYYSFISGFIFSILLFVIFTWSTLESPLFSICFSWAIIPLFIYGLEILFKGLRINKNYHKYIYSVILVIVLMINILQIINIFKFSM